ncbi:peptidase [Burkholderia sp. Leaf177]|uniref:PepSY-associated TM helix domain-containing protein n=1 Tax=Burkholderia sp. Leaf177 TaxID=1736287 RepID=UPI0006FBA3ED|nr:PepSY domain-containing protein [Burkholderia sp. Leaf177]KQR87113.1 peptidase [Burkholderia sp. Leaf177]
MQSASFDHARVLARHRTLWRWHFYAGLFVMPLLLVLAITGTLYCFQPQIEPLLYHDRMIVDARTEPRLSHDVLLAKAKAAEPRDAIPTTVVINTDARRSAEFVFKLQSGESESVYVDPYSGAVLGRLSVENRLMKQVRNIHRGLLLGKTGEIVMELAGCWTLVMIATGVALWWPKAQQKSGRFMPRLSSVKGRAWWRELHAVGGAWLAIGALFFVLSGLPWSSTWGKQFKALATSAQLGYPQGAWGRAHVHSTTATPAMNMADPSMAGMKMDDLPLPQTPWAVGATHVPNSVADATAPSITLDHVVGIAAQAGVQSGYDIALPTTPQGVYTVSYFPADPRDERTLHIDRYSGQILSDIAYRDYGRVAQWISYGTSLHMGRYFGIANQLLASAISLGLAAMTVSGFVMWRKRKPGRAVGAPSRPILNPPMRAWIVGMAALGIVFPLMGLTMLAVWLSDRVLFSPGRIASTR